MFVLTLRDETVPNQSLHRMAARQRGLAIRELAARARQVPRSGLGREAGGVFDRLSSLIGADQISGD